MGMGVRGVGGGFRRFRRKKGRILGPLGRSLRESGAKSDVGRPVRRAVFAARSPVRLGWTSPAPGSGAKIPARVIPAGARDESLALAWAASNAVIPLRSEGEWAGWRLGSARRQSLENGPCVFGEH